MTHATITANNVNLRTGPGTSFQLQGQVHTGASGTLLERHKSCDPAYPEEWYRLRFDPDNREAWMYSRYARLDDAPGPVPAVAAVGASGSMTIKPPPVTVYVAPTIDSLYPAPVHYDTMTNGFTAGHLGWDFAGSLGNPVVSGPFGGTCILASYCQKCGPAAVSALKPGEKPGNSAVLNDSAWNYGYGHYVIVRYDNAVLPESTQHWLATKGWTGYHAFVMYAHLKSFSIRQGDTFAGIQTLGAMGTSGNSDGPHLHLELRFGPKAEASWWVRLRPFLANPGVLFMVR